MAGLPRMDIMFIQHRYEMDWSQITEMRCDLSDLELVLHTGSAAVTLPRQTPRYSFRVMRCKALRVPRDCDVSAMVSCSLYLSRKVPDGGPWFPKK